MTSLQELSGLPLRDLVRCLAQEPSAVLGGDQHEHLAMIELLTFRVADEFPTLRATERETCLAVFARALDGAVARGVFDRHESLVRRLNLSVALLKQLPSSEHVGRLEPQALTRLLLDGLPASADEARAMSAGWRTLPVTDIRSLRAAKNLLRPGLQIARLDPATAADPRVTAWADVFPSLP